MRIYLNLYWFLEVAPGARSEARVLALTLSIQSTECSQLYFPSGEMRLVGLPWQMTFGGELAMALSQTLSRRTFTTA